MESHQENGIQDDLGKKNGDQSITRSQLGMKASQNTDDLGLSTTKKEVLENDSDRYCSSNHNIKSYACSFCDFKHL